MFRKLSSRSFPLILIFALSLIHPDTTLLAEEPALIGAPRWQATWIWGVKAPHPPNSIGLFRKKIKIRKPIKSLWFQLSGDDSYQVYVNGQLVKSGAFWWKTTDVVEVTKYFNQGENIIAAKVYNAVHPGGFLLQGTVEYEDGEEDLFITDRTWKFSDKEEEGWFNLEFDDSSWEYSAEMGPPPVGPWGDLPIQHLGKKEFLKPISLDVPERASAGDRIRISAKISPSNKLSHNYLSFFRLKRQDTVFELIELKPQVPTIFWQPGKIYQVGPVQLPLFKFLPSGEYELQFGLYKCAFESLLPQKSKIVWEARGEIITKKVFIVGREKKIKLTKAEVKIYRGSPTLFINDKPQFPMLFWGNPKWAKEFKATGIKVYTFDADLGWRSDDKYPYQDVDDQMVALLKGDENAYAILRVSLSAPEWWCNLHEEELTRYADGTGWIPDAWGGTKHQSFASLLWRKEAGEALKRLMEHIQNSPYADRVIGYHLCSGIYGEWHYWSPVHLPDTSEPMRQAFIKLAKEKYQTIERLNQAWKTNLTDFSQITIPTKDERFSSDFGMFRDPAKGNKIADYYECFFSSAVESIEHFCRIVKEVSKRKSLAGVFYGYAPDLGWNLEGDHLALEKLLDNPDIDFFSSPHSYSRRGLGDDGAFRAYPETIRLHGKLFFDEGDDRTYRANDPDFAHVKNLTETLQILWREFANVLTHSCGMWWMDQQGGWFSDKPMLQAIGQMKQIGDATVSKKHHRVSEVALFCDLKSFFWLANMLSGKNNISHPLMTDQIRELFQMGAPFDIYLLDDLFHPEMPEYKCYIFLNAFYIPSERRERIIKRLQCENKMLIFFYAPGFLDEKRLSVAHLSDLTGMKMEADEKGEVLNIELENPTSNLPTKFGLGKLQAPVFFVSDPAATVLGRFEASRRPALCLKKFSNWTSLYCLAPPLPWQILKSLLKTAGVHIYLETGDNLYVNNLFLAVHTTKAGKKTIRLPKKAKKIYDLINRKIVAQNSQSFTVILPAKSTALYSIQ